RISFFFQAEDGIRDFHVTGVQTCALPISPVERILDQVMLTHARTRTDDECIGIGVQRTADAFVERIDRVRCDAESQWPGACRTDHGREHWSVRVRDATSCEHLVEGVEFDDLITGREDRDEGPAIDAYPCGT